MVSLFVGFSCMPTVVFGQTESSGESDVLLEISHSENGAVTSVKLNGKAVFDASKHRRLTLFDKNPGLNHKSVFLYGEKVYSQTWDKDGPVGDPYIVLTPAERARKEEPLTPSINSGVYYSTGTASPVKETPVEKTTLSLNAKDARERALTYLGCPYKEGGYARTGFKTAGLIWHYFKSYGMNVPRLLRDQASYGEFVLKKDLCPGDVVVFKSGGTPNVAGIYLGNQEMIYMSYSKKVAKTVKIDTPYWNQRYGGSRRYFGVKLDRLETSHEYSPVFAEHVEPKSSVSKPAGTKLIPLPKDKVYEQGHASFYGGGDGFNGSPTANGEIFDHNKLTAAHKTLPFNTMVKVVRTDTGRSCIVRINDRGPFVRDRIIDLSFAAAKAIDMVSSGVTKVHLYIMK